jgi:hypothetical protein
MNMTSSFSYQPNAACDEPNTSKVIADNSKWSSQPVDLSSKPWIAPNGYKFNPIKLEDLFSSASKSQGNNDEPDISLKRPPAEKPLDDTKGSNSHASRHPFFFGTHEAVVNSSNTSSVPLRGLNERLHEAPIRQLLMPDSDPVHRDDPVAPLGVRQDNFTVEPFRAISPVSRGPPPGFDSRSWKNDVKSETFRIPEALPSLQQLGLNDTVSTDWDRRESVWLDKTTGNPSIAFGTWGEAFPAPSIQPFPLATEKSSLFDNISPMSRVSSSTKLLRTPPGLDEYFKKQGAPHANVPSQSFPVSDKPREIPLSLSELFESHRISENSANAHETATSTIDTKTLESVQGAIDRSLQDSDIGPAPLIAPLANYSHKITSGQSVAGLFFDPFGSLASQAEELYFKLLPLESDYTKVKTLFTKLRSIVITVHPSRLHSHQITIITKTCDQARHYRFSDQLETDLQWLMLVNWI